ncbi:MAG: lasso peptide biosynthesis B2 protein, partial [Proteobacteria bacterium]|nr:lasso peptide biosynthesis B2 protein [Pseudomonadota bacterium]
SFLFKSLFVILIYGNSITFIQQLLEDDIIEKKKAAYPFYIDRKITSDGVSNVDWRLPLEAQKVPVNFHVLKALTTLIKVNFYIKVRGLHTTLQLIKKSKKSYLNYIIPQEEELKDLANILNKACLMYPTRTKCLEWAMTFVLLALKKRWKCNLEIGVQNYPFFAHAWVECDGKVVLDSEDLRNGLAIILNEPFRRIKS